MLIEASKLIKLPVAADDTLSRVGEIQEVMIDPETGRLLGFLVQTGGFLSGKKALSVTDIEEWDPNGIVTKSVENLVEPEEIVRIKMALEAGTHLLGMKAVTESGKNLGQVENFLIDTETEQVVKYYLRDLFGKSRILTSDKVVKIEKVIIFRDDVDLPEGNVRAQEA